MPIWKNWKLVTKWNKKGGSCKIASTFFICKRAYPIELYIQPAHSIFGQVIQACLAQGALWQAFDE